MFVYWHIKKINMESSRSYNDYIVKSILANNRFGINDIKSVEELKSLCLIREDYPRIVELIKNGDIETIKQMKLSPVRTLEYLSIMKIKDDQGRAYIVTGYDNDDLSQDPQVIDVFPL